MKSSPPLESINPKASNPTNVPISALSSKDSSLIPFFVNIAETISGPDNKKRSNNIPFMIRVSTCEAAKLSFSDTGEATITINQIAIIRPTDDASFSSNTSLMIIPIGSNIKTIH